jgi:hypothetical protein
MCERKYREMRCKGARVMWKGERDVVAERCGRSGGKNENSGGDMECEWRQMSGGERGEK